MQCKDGTLDRLNIHNIVKRVAKDVSAKRKLSEGDDEKEDSGEERGDNETRVVNIVKGEGQYVFSEEGEKYLDCAASVTHVGHSHPDIVKAFNDSQHCILHWADRNVDHWNLEVRKKFLTRFRALIPKCLQEVVLVNSGSSANGLAIQLSQMVTGGSDVIVFDHSFHGSLSVTSCLSAMAFESSNVSPSTRSPQRSWVHILPIPDLYRGPYRECDPAAVMKYFCDAKHLIEKKVEKGAKIACLLMEPIFTFHGMSLPEPIYIQELVKYVRSLGALVVVDEVQGGLGRTGRVWAHENLGIVPDILTCGKPLSSGYPFAVMATSEKLASQIKVLTDVIEQEGVNAGPSLAVLEVMENERLLNNVMRVGGILWELLLKLKSRRVHVGQVKGRGLMVGIDLVKDKKTRAPAPKLATWLLVKMREKNIMMAKEGEFNNMVVIMPPLCFNVDNAQMLVSTLNMVLQDAETIGYDNLHEYLTDDEKFFKTGVSDDDEEQSCYEDMD